jgi:glycerate-2-kinase
MKKRAEEMAFKPCIITAEQKGETSAVARTRAKEMLDSRYAGHNAIILGGETTPKLPESPGKGGRNQHYAAASMLAMARYPGRWLVVSVGTDGSDFLPDVAGAIVDVGSLKKAKEKGMNVESYLRRYDSYTLLDRIGGCLIITSDTGTNVGDVTLYLLG